MVIQINNLKKSFGEQKVLDDVTIAFASGIYTLTGESGGGKTTLARILCNLEKKDSGDINPRGYKVSYMFQEPRLYPWLDVLENIVKVTDCSKERATELLDALELGADLSKYPYELSVGMQRRVSIARTISVNNADLYVFDEPFAGLDEDRKRIVCNLISRNINKNSIVLIISHETAEVSEISDHILKLENGKIYEK